MSTNICSRTQREQRSRSVSNAAHTDTARLREPESREWERAVHLLRRLAHVCTHSHTNTGICRGGWRHPLKSLLACALSPIWATIPSGWRSPLQATICVVFKCLKTETAAAAATTICKFCCQRTAVFLTRPYNNNSNSNDENALWRVCVKSEWKNKIIQK